MILSRVAAIFELPAVDASTSVRRWQQLDQRPLGIGQVRGVNDAGATPDHYGRSQLRRGAETPPIVKRLKHALSPCLGSRSGR